jgi:pyruvate,water dikinase
MEEVAKSAWYRYFDELGFDPMPRARMLRQHEGRAYLNLTLSAQRDAEQAAVEPLTVLVNNQPFPLAKWEKPGLLASIKVGRNRKKIEQLLENYRQQVEPVTQKAAAWYAKTQELRWSQADILQIMEEVERVSIPSFTLFLAARHNLELLCNRLLWATQDRQPFPANVALLQQAVAAVDGVLETRMQEDVLTLVRTAVPDQATVSWLRAGHYDDWQKTLPNQALAAGVANFLQRYGQRALNDGEMGQPRWEEAPALFFTILCDALQSPPPSKAKADPEPLLNAVAPDQRKVAQQQVQQARQLLLLQSQAVHAFAYILAGTRRWALAAAKEAQGDQRLLEANDVFFFQIEEVKQMMTGEWNISSRQTIHNTCAERKAAYARWQAHETPPVLIGDVAATMTPAEMNMPGAASETVARFWEKLRFVV